VRSHDLGRTGASQLAIEDAWCDLTVDWFADDIVATASAQTMGPIIYDNRVYQLLETGAAGSSVRIFDLATGAPLTPISIPPPGNFVENDPLIVGGFLYLAGGDSRIIYKYDITVNPAVLVYASAPMAAAGGPLRRANLMLVNVAGTDVLFFGSQLGRAFAVNAGTGALYAGWATNPITLDAGQLVQGTATDGSLLYFATRLAGFDGDVWAINPATGATSWKLSTAGGRQGAIVFPGSGAPVLAEGFTSLSVEAGVVFAGSNCQAANFPADGVFYRLDAATGGLLSASASNAFVFANPIVDINLVYCQGTSRWVGTSMGGDMVAYNKLNGALAWVSEFYWDVGVHNGTISRFFNNGLLTCEPEPAVDIIVNADERGVLHFWNSLDGTEIFRRRWDFGIGAASLAGGTAIGTDASGDNHILCGSLRGALVSLSKGADRSRLEIQNFDPTLAVEFSVSTSVIYTDPNIVVNTGCADLTFSAVNVDELSFGSTDPGIAPFVPVKPGLLDAATFMADKMTLAAKGFLEYKETSEFGMSDEAMTTSNEESNRNERGYRAALAVPPYLNSVVQPFVGQVVPAGDTIDLVLDIDASLIERGPQTFYIELCTNDPDYFLNAGSVALPNTCPELVVTLVGGCLLDSTTLEFGVGAANYQFVFNDGFLAESSGPFGFNIDGDDDAVWMGSYIYGVSQHRIALAIHYSGFNFISWQADPNWCDNDCKPALTTGVSLGAIWNGASYTPISGNMVCASGVDSVQNFGSPWDWDTPGPFDPDSTMGLSLNSRTIGALDVPQLASLTVEILEFTERNGQPVPDWKFGMWADLDIFVNSTTGTGKDTAKFDPSHSAAWHTEIGGNTAWGLIKLPYGCGYAPLKNAVLLDSDNSMYAASTGGYLDSFYVYCTRPAGLTGMPGASGARDQSTHMTVVEHDFAASETFDFGIGFFGLHGVPAGATQLTAVRNLADLTNKWVGFGRGDVNDDEAVNLSDIMTLADIVGGSVPGAIPFEHLADVDADGDVDNTDLNYLINYYFHCGPCPLGEWQF
jgi:outer membrane protein assembly factor BamB